MKRFLLLLVFAGIASAQTVTIQVTAKLNTVQKIWNILLRPKTVLAEFTCDVTEMEPGETATCTVTLNQPARPVGATIAITLPTGFTGPPSVLIPGGAASATFSITRLDTFASNPTIFPVAWSMRLGACAQRYASVLLACCARADRCGLRDNEIAWELCGG
jgi:hypothetical protein